tara:strand:- start:133 stop:321 length:189 start_codon:yes stop_codon:yes gene_type:complete
VLERRAILADIVELKGPGGEVHIVIDGAVDTEVLIKLVKRYGDRNKKLIIAELEKFLTKGNC